MKWVDRDGPKWPASVRVREGMGFEVEITKNWLRRFFFFKLKNWGKSGVVKEKRDQGGHPTADRPGSFVY